MFRRTPWFACFFSLTVYAAPLHGATVLLDNFNRTGSLSGSAPTTNTGQTWTATGAYVTDGSKLVADPAFLQAAYLPLPVPITSGNVYTVSATTAYNVASSDDLAYMMFGFFDSTPSYDGSTVFDGGKTIAIGPRNRRDSVANMLDGHSHPSDITSPDGTNGVTFGVRLYESTANAWVADLVELAPHAQVLSLSPTSVSIAPISTIGMVSASTHPPFIDNFTFEVSPALPDYNHNNIVDAADYVLWRKSPSAYGGNPAGYTAWRANFGQTAGSGSGTSVNASVPEPATLVLLMFSAASWCLRRRRAA